MKTYLIVDAGNTRTKIARYKNDELIDVTYFSSEERLKMTIYLSRTEVHDLCIFSSVLNPEETLEIKKFLEPVLLFSEAKIPLNNAYETPKTLGADRLANAVAATVKAQGNRLVIDVGTCIKFDFVDSENTYHGGSISPGIHLRYKALHEFTGNLPLLSGQTKNEFIGKSTDACMQSGVLNGIQEEINGFIRYYESKYEGLTIFVTGGDHINFDYSTKNGIFADENLTIFGLLQILKANVQ